MSTSGAREIPFLLRHANRNNNITWKPLYLFPLLVNLLFYPWYTFYFGNAADYYVQSIHATRLARWLEIGVDGCSAARENHCVLVQRSSGLCCIGKYTCKASCCCSWQRFNNFDECMNRAMVSAVQGMCPPNSVCCCSQATVEGMFEDLNTVLNNGDLPSLFGQEDIEHINFVCRRDCISAHLPPTRVNVYAQVWCLCVDELSIHLVDCTICAVSYLVPGHSSIDEVARAGVK